MIIFDLDGTLADCEHRRHFVQAPEDYCHKCYEYLLNPESIGNPLYLCSCGRQPGIWRCNWQAFYEACDKDKPILYTMQIMRSLFNYSDFTTPPHIWCGRCESVREKTEDWLQKYGCNFELKMRPIGDHSPTASLKEYWLDLALKNDKQITFVFDSHKPSIDMWQRRGVFVFDVSQGKGDF